MKAHGREQAARVTLQRNLRSLLSVIGLKPHRREDRATEFIELALLESGVFYRVADGTPLFFRRYDKKLYEISSRPNTPFVRHVTYMADLSVKANRKGFSLGQCLDRLQARVVEEAKIVHVHGLAFNSPEAEVVAVNDLGGGMWYRKRGGQWRKKPNGAHGILFWTPPDLVEPWTPKFSRDPAIYDTDHLEWLLDQAHFADDVLSARAQRMLWHIDPAVASGLPGPTRNTRIHDFGVSRVQQNPVDALQSDKPSSGPRLATIERPVHGGYPLILRAVSPPDPNPHDVGLGLVDYDRADRQSRLFVENSPPCLATVDGLPEPTARRPDIYNIRI